MGAGAESVFSSAACCFKMGKNEFYLRYYVGHKGKFGHEFLEFEFRPDGKLRYANNSKNDTMIRKEAYVHQCVLDELKRVIEDSEIMQEMMPCGHHLTVSDVKSWKLSWGMNTSHSLLPKLVHSLMSTNPRMRMDCALSTIWCRI